MARKGGNKKSCDKYKMSGRKIENKKLKQLRYEKRLAKFAKRKEEGKCYEYSASKALAKQKEARENGIIIGTNVNSNRAKHTAYAKLTSIFRKLNNQIEEDKLKEMKERAKLQAEKRRGKTKIA